MTITSMQAAHRSRRFAIRTGSQMQAAMNPTVNVPAVQFNHAASSEHSHGAGVLFIPVF